jgi:hypothetical protein
MNTKEQSKIKREEHQGVIMKKKHQKRVGKMNNHE